VTHSQSLEDSHAQAHWPIPDGNYAEVRAFVLRAPGEGLVELLGLQCRATLDDTIDGGRSGILATASPPPEPGDKPGWTTVALRFSSHLGAQPLLAFGPDVEVLTPEELRRTLASKAEATATLYHPRQDAPYKTEP